MRLVIDIFDIYPLVASWVCDPSGLCVNRGVCKGFEFMLMPAACFTPTGQVMHAHGCTFPSESGCEYFGLQVQGWWSWFIRWWGLRLTAAYCAKTKMWIRASACQTAFIQWSYMYRHLRVASKGKKWENHRAPYGHSVWFLIAELPLLWCHLSIILLPVIPLTIPVASCIPPSPCNASHRSSKARFLLHSMGEEVAGHPFGSRVTAYCTMASTSLYNYYGHCVDCSRSLLPILVSETLQEESVGSAIKMRAENKTLVG